MSFFQFHWIRFIGAVVALFLAIIYLIGFEKVSLVGFTLIGAYGAIVCILLQKGTLPGKCDLCGNKGLLKAEYGHGFSNARLVLNCPHCGRVINTAKNGLNIERDKPGS